MYDLKISGGLVVDGTGAPAYAADVGIKDGMIVEVGKLSGAAKEEVQADGAHVTPGFTDIHTHYDGQVSWDEELAPSSLHGVTTCVMGSCGVGFAPVRENDRERLVRLMEGVEDIPGSALSEGIQWGWASFPEYMDALDAMPHSIDFLNLIPHDALRVYVMGERALASELATDGDIEHMRKLVRAAMEAGAAGFSTGRSDNHRSADGDPTPASEAIGRELSGIAKAFVGLDYGVLQAVSDFDIMQGDERFHPEFDLLEGMLKAAGGRPMSISTMQRDHSAKQWEWIFERAEACVEQGYDVRCQVAPRGIGVMLGLTATFHPFMGFPTFKKLAHLPEEELLRQLRTSEVRDQMLREKSEPVAGDGSPLPPLADFFLANLDMVAMRLFRLGENPNYEPNVTESFAAEAMRREVSVLRVIYDAMLEDDGKALLYFPVYNYSGMNLDTVREMITHPLALPGLSDGGAHVGTICDASFPTFLMTHWARDRAHGRLPLERVVKMQSRDTARFMGILDRGEIRPGQRADINIVDMANLRLRHPVLTPDLPAGGERLMQFAEGYVATYVAGQCIRENGRATGARPGRLVRLSQQ